MNTRERATNGQPSGRQFRFNDYVLDLDSGFLRRNGEEVPLRPKAFDALVCLVQRPGTLVSKNDLVDAVWAGAAVTDNSLSQCLFELRRALADDDQTMIRTVARRGFVFQAQVSASRASETGSAAGTPTGALASRESTVAPAASDAAVRPTNDPRPAPGASARRMAGIALLVTGLLVGLVWLSMHRALTISEAPVQLTDFNDSAVQPSLSHDGRMVAFIRGGGFGTPGVSRGRVYLKMLPNGQAVELQSDAAARDGPVFSRSNPVFSPDDARIIYTALLSGLRWDSWQVPVLGGAPQPFLPNASGVTWLDDHRLLFSTITAGIHMGIATSTESRDAYKEIYFPTREDGMAHRSAAAPDRKSLLIVATSQTCPLRASSVPSQAAVTTRRPSRLNTA